jgi:hypothetical protein
MAALPGTGGGLTHSLAAPPTSTLVLNFAREHRALPAYLPKRSSGTSAAKDAGRKVIAPPICAAYLQGARRGRV